MARLGYLSASILKGCLEKGDAGVVIVLDESTKDLETTRQMVLTSATEADISCIFCPSLDAALATVIGYDAESRWIFVQNDNDFREVNTSQTSANIFKLNILLKLLYQPFIKFIWNKKRITSTILEGKKFHLLSAISNSSDFQPSVQEKKLLKEQDSVKNMIEVCNGFVMEEDVAVDYIVIMDYGHFPFLQNRSLTMNILRSKIKRGIQVLGADFCSQLKIEFERSSSPTTRTSENDQVLSLLLQPAKLFEGLCFTLRIPSNSKEKWATISSSILANGGEVKIGEPEKYSIFLLDEESADYSSSLLQIRQQDMLLSSLNWIRAVVESGLFVNLPTLKINKPLAELDNLRFVKIYVNPDIDQLQLNGKNREKMKFLLKKLGGIFTQEDPDKADIIITTPIVEKSETNMIQTGCLSACIALKVGHKISTMPIGYTCPVTHKVFSISCFDHDAVTGTSFVIIAESQFWVTARDILKICGGVVGCAEATATFGKNYVLIYDEHCVDKLEIVKNAILMDNINVLGSQFIEDLTKSAGKKINMDDYVINGQLLPGADEKSRKIGHDDEKKGVDEVDDTGTDSEDFSASPIAEQYSILELYSKQHHSKGVIKDNVCSSKASPLHEPVPLLNEKKSMMKVTKENEKKTKHTNDEILPKRIKLSKSPPLSLEENPLIFQAPIVDKPSQVNYWASESDSPSELSSHDDQQVPTKSENKTIEDNVSFLNTSVRLPATLLHQKTDIKVKIKPASTSWNKFHKIWKQESILDAESKQIVYLSEENLRLIASIKKVFVSHRFHEGTLVDNTMGPMSTKPSSLGRVVAIGTDGILKILVPMFRDANCGLFKNYIWNMDILPYIPVLIALFPCKDHDTGVAKAISIASELTSMLMNFGVGTVMTTNNSSGVISIMTQGREEAVCILEILGHANQSTLEEEDEKENNNNYVVIVVKRELLHLFSNMKVLPSAMMNIQIIERCTQDYCVCNECPLTRYGKFRALGVHNTFMNETHTYPFDVKNLNNCPKAAVVFERIGANKLTVHVPIADITEEIMIDEITDQKIEDLLSTHNRCIWKQTVKFTLICNFCNSKFRAPVQALLSPSTSKIPCTCCGVHKGTHLSTVNLKK